MCLHRYIIHKLHLEKQNKTLLASNNRGDHYLSFFVYIVSDGMMHVHTDLHLCLIASIL